MIITSANNEIIKSIKKLYDKKNRDKKNLYIIEGIKVIYEAYIANQDFKYIVICQEILDNVNIEKEYVEKLIKQYDSKIIYVSNNVFNTISDTVSPQGLLAVLEIKDNKNKLEIIEDNILFLDRVQDAGNLGTILRTASAFGFNTVVLNQGCCDVYNNKVIRSAMGNIFKLNIIILDNAGIELLKKQKEVGYTIYSTSLNNAVSIYEIEFKNKKIIIMGNEANGVSDEILKISDYNCIIPMYNNTESLNVAVATGIVLSKTRRK